MSKTVVAALVATISAVSAAAAQADNAALAPETVQAAQSANAPAGYVNLGIGKCRVASTGGDPLHGYHHAAGDAACTAACNNNANCCGYSVSSHTNCLVWNQQDLVASAAHPWGNAHCFVKTSNPACSSAASAPADPAPSTPPSPPPPSPPATPPFQQAVTSPTGITYHFYTSAMTWTAARDFCAQHHNRLAAVESQADQEAINVLVNMSYHQGALTNIRGVWLGGTALTQPATSGPHGNGPLSPTGGRIVTDATHWRWYPDVDNLGSFAGQTYHNWRPSEPNSGGSTTNPGKENCLFIWAPPHARWGDWNDWHCANNEGFVCEDQRTVPSPPPSPPPSPAPSPPATTTSLRSYSSADRALFVTEGPGASPGGFPYGYTLDQCKGLCDNAPDCNSFAYSQGQQSCWTKTKCGSSSCAVRQHGHDWRTYYVTGTNCVPSNPC